jgi:hypothetical protein
MFFTDSNNHPFHSPPPRAPFVLYSRIPQSCTAQPLPFRTSHGPRISFRGYYDAVDYYEHIDYLNLNNNRGHGTGGPTQSSLPSMLSTQSDSHQFHSPPPPRSFVLYSRIPHPARRHLSPFRPCTIPVFRFEDFMVLLIITSMLFSQI